MRKQIQKEKSTKIKKIVRYYDYKLSNDIFKILNVDPFLAVRKMKDYLEVFSRDYSMMCTYCLTLITIGEFDDAYETLLNLEKNYANDHEYHVDRPQGQNEIVSREIKLCRLRYLANAYKYEDALKFLKKNNEELEKSKAGNLNILDFFLNHRLGNIELDRENQKNYLMRQIVEHKKEDFIDKFYSERGKGTTTFYDDFDIEKVYDAMHEHLQTGECLHTAFNTDTYYFKYDSCGKVDNRYTSVYRSYVVGKHFQQSYKVAKMVFHYRDPL